MQKSEASAQHTPTDGSGQPKRTFAAKLRRSCARFWWLYFLVFAAIVLVVVLPIVYVGYPKLAQKTINNAKIRLNSYAIQRPTPDSFDLRLDYTLLSNSSNHANLDSYNASLYLLGSEDPYVTFEAPAVKTSKATDVSIQQNIKIEHPEELVKFCLLSVGSQSFELIAGGKGGLKLGSLPHTTVKYNKTIESKGLNKFTGFNITEFSLLKNTGLFNANANGTAFIPNPSNITLEAGNVTATMHVANTLIGNLTMPDVTLVPGNETYTFYATTNQTAVAGLLQRKEYRCGVLPLDIAPDQSIYDGQVVPYLTTALRAATLRVDLNVGPALAKAGFGGLIPKDCK